MCLAIYKPAGVLPDWGALEEGFKSNKDGAGFVVISGDKLLIDKGHFTFDEFRESYGAYADLESAIHFRYATHGKTNAANCHPFSITPDLAMIHNGVLPIQCSTDESMSDTWHYVHHILRPMAERDPDFFIRPDVQFMGEAAIEGSKFVFLRSDGEACIWNEDKGHWASDIWYSNTSYKQARSTIGYAKWWQSDEPTPSVEDDECSRYRDFLSNEARWAYDDLLEDGYSIQELDDMVKEHGQESLIDLLDTLKLSMEGDV